MTSVPALNYRDRCHFSVLKQLPSPDLVGQDVTDGLDPARDHGLKVRLHQTGDAWGAINPEPGSASAERLQLLASLAASPEADAQQG